MSFNYLALDTLCFWIQKGVELDSEIIQSSLTLNSRIMRAGLKFIQSVCSFSGFLAQTILKLKFGSSGTTVQQRLVHILNANTSTPVVQNLILKALDATISTRLGKYII